jgi:hypothetical protein
MLPLSDFNNEITVPSSELRNLRLTKLPNYITETCFIPNNLNVFDEINTK